jgi:hypothetical protein
VQNTHRDSCYSNCEHLFSETKLAFRLLHFLRGTGTEHRVAPADTPELWGTQFSVKVIRRTPKCHDEGAIQFVSTCNSVTVGSGALRWILFIAVRRNSFGAVPTGCQFSWCSWQFTARSAEQMQKCITNATGKCTGPDRPLRFQEVEAPRFQDSRHLKVVRLSALRTGRLYTSGNMRPTHFF